MVSQHDTLVRILDFLLSCTLSQPQNQCCLALGHLRQEATLNCQVT